MSLHAQACSVLEAFTHPDPRQGELAREYREFLDANSEGVWRENRVGHITASALVIDPGADNTLLTLHPKVGRWLQLGGHLEPGDDSVRAAAIREVVEESGFTVGAISEQPIRLDRHPVPCGRGADGLPAASEHLDVQYAVIVPTLAPPTISEESDDLRWFSRRQLPELDDSVLGLLADAARAVDESTGVRWVSFG